MLYLKLLAMTLMLSACATSSLQTTVDFDSGAYFSDLTTYSWLEAKTPVIENPAIAHDEFLLARIKRQIDKQLATQGYVQVTQAADFLVTYQLNIADKSHVTVMDDVYTYPMGWGTGRRYTLGARNRPRQFVYQYMEGALIIDIVDPISKQLMWRGTASDEVKGNKTIQQQQEKIDQAVKKVLAQFPPS